MGEHLAPEWNTGSVNRLHSASTEMKYNASKTSKNNNEQIGRAASKAKVSQAKGNETEVLEFGLHAVRISCTVHNICCFFERAHRFCKKTSEIEIVYNSAIPSNM